VHSVRKPWWQQATALVTVSTGGVITGFSFVPGAAATMTSPTSVPLHLMALERAAKPAETSAAGDARLRSAIVNVANYYLRLAQSRTPAQMEALIWAKDSLDGVDHGESCAAFASLTLELAAQAVGQQSWVSGGGTYPWPLHDWADVRVDPNPDSLGITSVMQDAQAHNRWHPLGDGYTPQPGDWVVYDGHVEVVTSYSGGVLDSIGADSLPNLTVNAHSVSDPLEAQGVVGFVDNGHLGGGAAPAAQQAQGGQGSASVPGVVAPASQQGTAGQGSGNSPGGADQRGLVQIPGVAAQAFTTKGAAQIPGATGQDATASGSAGSTSGASSSDGSSRSEAAGGGASGESAAGGGTSGNGSGPGSAASAKATADIPGDAAPTGLAAGAAGAAQPARRQAASQPSYRKYTAPSTSSTPGTRAQQAFINQIAPGAVAAQQRYGVPAAVTIAQAIDESAWGASSLAAQDNNLFGIKGTGPAGSVTLPTQEYQGGQWVTIDAQFRVYYNIAESISDHAELLANSGYYTRAMADRAVPDAFANDLTGVYATDPEYGSNLIALMHLYNLYRFDTPASQQQATPAATPAPSAATPASSASPGAAQIPGVEGPSPSAAGTSSGPAASPSATPTPSGTPSPVATTPTPAATPTPTATSTPATTPSPAGTPVPSTSATPAATPSAAATTPAAGTGSTSPTAPAAGAAGVPGSGATSANAAIPGIGHANPGVVSGGAVSGSPVVSGGPPASGNPSAPGNPSIPGSSPVYGTTADYLTSIGYPATPDHLATLDYPTAPVYATAPAAGGFAPVPHSAAVRGYPPAPPRAQSARPAATARPAVTARGAARIPGLATPGAARYQAQLPTAVTTAYFATAKTPLARAEPLYRDVASDTGIHWELLAACDWMQCQAQPRLSPVCGERLGMPNPDGTVYMTKSEALAQCATDLIGLAGAVYRIDLTAPVILSVRALADAFAAFRWGALLRRHRVSAMEFPYSVAGLTAQHLKMHWPAINDPDAPDKPGGKFRPAFGAVPVVLCLNYPATV
jgi:flagellum-specific peptidoglycan hydrolase FlgJ